MRGVYALLGEYLAEIGTENWKESRENQDFVVFPETGANHQRGRTGGSMAATVRPSPLAALRSNGPDLHRSILEKQ